jgi:pimeloyl-ACP methyl ester carboxylesterase
MAAPEGVTSSPVSALVSTSLHTLGQEPLRALEADGLSLVRTPPRDGKAEVMLLHGWVMNHTAWFDAARGLASAGYGLSFPDLPGHGRSGPLGVVKNSEVFASMAERVVRAMDAADIAEAHIAGYSMGGTVALALARHHPDRVRSLFLLDPMVRFPHLQMLFTPPRLHWRFVKNMALGMLRPRGRELLRALVGLHCAGFWLPGPIKRALLSLFAFPPRPPEELTYVGCRDDTDVQIFLDGFACTDWWSTAQALEGKYRVNYVDVLERFERPIHLAGGIDDAFAPPAFLRWLAKRGARGPRGAPHPLTIIEGGDHLAVCTRPDVVGAALLAWLDDAEGPKRLAPVA